MDELFIILSKLLPAIFYPIGIITIALVVYWMYNGKGKIASSAVFVASLVLLVAGNEFVSVSLVRSLEWRYLPPESYDQEEIIVVLGGGTGPAVFPREIVELNSAADRVFYATWLYHQGIAPRLLLTGGDIPWLNESGSPSGEMEEILVMLDVPTEDILIESESRNTYENALFSKKILEEIGITRIILVTSALHMPRSVALFENQGLEVIPAPTDYMVTEETWAGLFKGNIVSWFLKLWPSVNNIENTTLVLKEYLGMIIYRLRGWL